MDTKNPNEWEDLDTDEIASIASDELREIRPNRWKGPKSTWRSLTEEERSLWKSLRRIDDQDLSAHLYNTFALRKRARDPVTAQDVTVQMNDGRLVTWEPPKLWAAWPLAEGHLPKEDFVAQPDDADEDDRFTFRKEEIKMPSSDLQEELGAFILRTAKRKFNKRRKKWSAVRPSVESRVGSPFRTQASSPPMEEDSQTPTKSKSGSPSKRPQRSAQSDRMDTEDEIEGESDEEEYQAHTPTSRFFGRKAPVTYEPVFSADDELSYQILQPSVRHILSKLDSTLQILHNTRAIRPGYESESDNESSTSENSPNEDMRKTLRKRLRQRSADLAQTEKLRTSKRGRPRKVHVPLEGESYDDMLVRIAREGHRKLPPRREIEVEDPGFEEWYRSGMEKFHSDRGQELGENNRAEEEKRDGEMKREVKGEQEKDEGDHQKEDAEEDDLEAEQGEPNTSRRGTKVWGLRDWSDVIGAASLAGFPPDVIARTAKRCANLFGEGMTVRNLHEVPTSEGNGVQTAEYRPEPIRLSDSDAESFSSASSEDEPDLLQRRIASRHSSLAPFSSMSPASASASPSLSRSRSRPLFSKSPTSRSRSRSMSTGPQHFCPIPACERAAAGFSRKANLKRHMELVHGGASPSTPTGAVPVSEVDSEDETLGAVHVDGFLRPVVPSRGWRGEDMGSRKRKRFYGDRKGKSVQRSNGESDGDEASD